MSLIVVEGKVIYMNNFRLLVLFSIFKRRYILLVEIINKFIDYLWNSVRS